MNKKLIIGIIIVAGVIIGTSLFTSYNMPLDKSTTNIPVTSPNATHGKNYTISLNEQINIHSNP